MSTVRQRKGLIGMIQDLDAFPKVDDDHRETSAAGGGFSICVFALIAVLVLSEIYHFFRGGFRYNYEIDPDFDKKLKLNIDMMVAMKCSHIGADILDQTGENADAFGSLEEESVDFDLNNEHRIQFETLRAINVHLRRNFWSLHGSIWSSVAAVHWEKSRAKDGMTEEEGGGKGKGRGRVITLAEMFPFVFEDTGNPDEKNGCRFRGTLEVNKVAGNFHITAGKSVPVLPRGHAHLSFMMRESDYNFSHRIFHLGFGERDLSAVNPLDGEEKISHDSSHLFQYFVQVVPTTLESTFSNVELYQYAVTEQNRTISHSKGSHGLPGIFVKYDLSPLRVSVKRNSVTVAQLLVRLCAIAGGVFATLGIIRHLVSSTFCLVWCRLKGTESDDIPRRHHHHSLHSSSDNESLALSEAPLLSVAQTWKHSEAPRVSVPDLPMSEKVPFRDL